MDTEREYSRIEQCGVCQRDYTECPYYETEQTTPCQHYLKPIDNSRMFSHFFSTKGRIGRGEYLLTLVIGLIITFIFSAIAWSWISHELATLNVADNSYIAVITNCVICLPLAALLVLAGYKRCHDAHAPTWYAWVPSVSLFVWLGWISVVIFSGTFFLLVFQNSDEGINAYGSEPGRPYDEQLTEAGVEG